MAEFDFDRIANIFFGALAHWRVQIEPLVAHVPHDIGIENCAVQIAFHLNRGIFLVAI